MGDVDGDVSLASVSGVSTSEFAETVDFDEGVTGEDEAGVVAESGGFSKGMVPSGLQINGGPTPATNF